MVNPQSGTAVVEVMAMESHGEVVAWKNQEGCSANENDEEEPELGLSEQLKALARATATLGWPGYSSGEVGKKIRDCYHQLRLQKVAYIAQRAITENFRSH